MLPILRSIVGIICGGEAGDGFIWSNIEHENLHFDNEENVDMSSQNYEESDYGLDLHLIYNHLAIGNGVLHILGEVASKKT